MKSDDIVWAERLVVKQAHRARDILIENQSCLRAGVQIKKNGQWALKSISD